MEIERKFLVKHLPENLENYPHVQITQAYISTNPVIRIRQMDHSFILTVKGSGLLSREEAEFILDEASFSRLMKKTEGSVIEKIRYKIPWKTYTIELDVFHGIYQGFIMAEIEYPDETTALQSELPDWFGTEVTMDSRFQNSSLSSNEPEEAEEFMKYQFLLQNATKI